MPTREQRARKLGVPVGQLPDGRGKNPNSWKNTSRGKDHYKWNGGRMLSKHGYVKVRVGVDNPLSDINGYAYEHLLVWCAAGRIKPLANQILHHKNEDKTDNQLSNLELLTRREHAAEHHRMLSDSQVREIRIRYDAGEDATALAEEFNIPFQRAYKFIRGEARIGAAGPIQSGTLRKNANRNRIGKKAAGRLLDGVEHNGYPVGGSRD